MEPNKKTGLFWKTSVALLILINICLLIMTWVKPKEKERSVAGEGGPAVYVIQHLNFTEQQIKAYNVLRNRHHDLVNMLKGEAEELRNNYFNNLKTNTPDLRLRDSLAGAIADNQKQIELLTFNHFVQVRQLCNDSQKQKFDNIINDVLKMMSRPPRGPNGPPPGGRPPRDGENGPPPPPQ